MNKQWLIGALSALMSLSVGAAVDETKVQSRTNAEFQKEISSNFVNLTPDAIEAGLRDLTIIGTVNKGEGDKPDIVWHSISKVVGNEQVAAALSEPLGSPKVTELPKVGEEFDIVGNLDSLLADYLRMMAEAKKNELTLKEEAAEKDSSTSGSKSGSSSGFFDNNSTEKPDTGADDFIVKPDTTTKRTVECSISYDFDSLIASEMAKVETVSSNTNEVVSTTDCSATGKTYPIKQDFTQSKCTAITDFSNSLHYFAFRFYIDKSGTGDDAEYVSECKTDTKNPVQIYQSVSDCGVSENLTTYVTTINKKWYYEDKGAQVFISDCMPSTETYQIVESDTDCVPFLNENLGTVYTQAQLIWIDGNGAKHKVTECRPSTTELQLSKEFKGTLEHDYVGGVSYEISRDYYVYKGTTVYVNEFSRDPSVSYPHYRSTDGCTTANDDTNRRSRIFEKTFITRKGVKTDIIGCTATTNYIPYTYLGVSNWFSATSSTPCRTYGYDLSGLIANYRSQIADYGAPTVWIHSPGSRDTKPCEYGGGDKGGSSYYQTAQYYGTQESWRRYNGTIYSIPTIYAKWN
ncbi:hypothetical protein NMS10_003140 [Vibrio cholerae]|nr:hypothetical protein [Vibrio cholerae]EJL6452485.1 hypothetical protein [Vibrio cholerae]